MPRTLVITNAMACSTGGMQWVLEHTDRRSIRTLSFRRSIRDDITVTPWTRCGQSAFLDLCEHENGRPWASVQSLKCVHSELHLPLLRRALRSHVFPNLKSLYLHRLSHGRSGRVLFTDVILNHCPYLEELDVTLTSGWVATVLQNLRLRRLSLRNAATIFVNAHIVVSEKLGLHGDTIIIHDDDEIGHNENQPRRALSYLELDRMSVTCKEGISNIEAILPRQCRKLSIHLPKQTVVAHWGRVKGLEELRLYGRVIMLEPDAWPTTLHLIRCTVTSGIVVSSFHKELDENFDIEVLANGVKMNIRPFLYEDHV